MIKIENHSSIRKLRYKSLAAPFINMVASFFAAFTRVAALCPKLLSSKLNDSFVYVTIPFSMVKMQEHEIKAILEPEFSITADIPLAYGGRGIKRGTKLSFRYFLIFNTLSKDVIDNGKLFFDKLNINRYRDVWPQIFDLTVGVTDFEILRIEKQIADVQKEIFRLEQDLEKAKKAIDDRDISIALIVKHAKEAELVDECLSVEDAFKEVENLVSTGKAQLSVQLSIEQEYEAILKRRNDILIQLNKLYRFQKSYSKYKQSLKEELDALKPISYINQNFTAQTSGEYKDFLQNLYIEFSKIKSASHDKRPFEYDINKKIENLRHELDELDSKFPQIAQIDYKLIPAADKLVSLGEIKAEYKTIKPCNQDTDGINVQIEKKREQIEELKTPYLSTEDNRTLKVQTLNDYIQQYITIAETALDEYGKYCAWFDHKKAILSLRKKQSAVVANISSSSDHLFMHLCLFAGLHEMLISQGCPFVPSFLIMDQPSRPYFNSTVDFLYSESKNKLRKKDDWSKVRNIFSLWNQFLDNIKAEEKHFQIIVLEHVEESAWAGFENIHLVETFDGIENALIPPQVEV